MSTVKSTDYHDYVIKDGKFVGEFEEMYRNVDDPWHCVELAGSLDNDLLLAVIRRLRSDVRTMLDVGCGLGELTRLIRDEMPDARLIACDVSPTALESARNRVPGASFFTHDLNSESSLPVESGSIDLIVAAQIMWYVLPNLDRIIAG